MAKRIIVAFDDLDIRLNVNNDEDKRSLLELIRLVKKYNTDYLINTNAAVLVFLRDDIGDKLCGTDADKTKIFTSYEHHLNWYQYCFSKEDEKNTLLRRFINKRIAIAFDKAGIEYNLEDPWLSFVNEDPSQTRTNFKYILDHTFYLPRDIMLIFKDISERRLPIPISHENINSLLRDFAPLRISEMKDELCAVADPVSVKKMFKIASNISKQGLFKYKELIDAIKSEGLSEDMFYIMIDYCIIVPCDSDRKYYFNYREQSISRGFEDYRYGVPRIIKVYYNYI